MSIFEGTPRPDRPSATEINAMMESSTDKAYQQGQRDMLKKCVEVVKEWEGSKWIGKVSTAMDLIRKLEALGGNDLTQNQNCVKMGK